MTRELAALAKSTGLKWKRNALRKSFISYRVASIKNVNQVALECGNSAAMIFKNYREVVRESESAAWFSVFPAKIENVLAMVNG